MKTQLKNRILWFDGTNQVDPEMVPELFMLGIPLNRIVVNRHNEDTELFNRLSDDVLADEKLENSPFDLTWQVPEEYKHIDLRSHVMGLLPKDDRYAARAEAELKEIERRGMELLVKTLIYVVDQFKASGTVWGVGRGSSCASLVLYLIGLHKVDPIRFNIPMAEFFHD